MKYPYIKFPSSNPTYKWISRPFIPLKITGPKGVWEGYGLIDSGADRSLFNIEVAEVIGINLEKAKAEIFGGIEGGLLEAKIAKCSLQIIGIEREITIEAGFVDSKVVGIILGQDGFFDGFKIKFEKDHDVVELTVVR